MAGYSYQGPGSLTVPLGAGILCCLLYLLISVGLSTLTYYAIEKPCRKWINRKWARRQEMPLATSR
jgi:peptidoglycan/LPS O-acetylase OafA/YrhL